jgi:hypothetical protein
MPLRLPLRARSDLLQQCVLPYPDVRDRLAMRRRHGVRRPRGVPEVQQRNVRQPRLRQRLSLDDELELELELDHLPGHRHGARRSLRSAPWLLACGADDRVVLLLLLLQGALTFT